MKDILELFNAIFMICQSMTLLVYMYMAAFFFVFLLGRKDVYDRIVVNTVGKLNHIATIAKAKSLED